VLGTSGNDVMGPAAGVDGFASGDGDDTITPGVGTFDISGGDGFDTVVLTGDRAAWSVSYAPSPDDGVILSDGTSTVTLHNVEQVKFDDIATIAGSGGDDTITPGAGTFDISGGDGNDTVVLAGNLSAWTVSYAPSPDDGIILSDGTSTVTL